MTPRLSRRGTTGWLGVLTGASTPAWPTESVPVLLLGALATVLGAGALAWRPTRHDDTPNDSLTAMAGPYRSRP